MKKCKIWAICFLILTVFTGCGTGFPDMTQAEEEAVVEYAAGVLMRHMKDYDSRLVDLSLYKEPAEEEKTEDTEQGGMDKTADTDTIDATTPSDTMTLDELLLPDDMELNYNSYEIVDTYPGGEDANPYFSLDASEGKKLLVMSFSLSNTSDTEKEVDFFSKAPRCTVIINGTIRQNALSTLLLEDFSTFIGTVKAGETVSLVLLAEVDESALAEISELSLSVKTEAGTASIPLQ